MSEAAAKEKEKEAVEATNGQADAPKGAAPTGDVLIEKHATFKYGSRTFKIPYVKLMDSLTKEEDKELEDSIRSVGIIHPVVVDDNDVVLAGHNRLMKAHKIGLKINQVPIHVRKRDKSDEERLEVVFASNFVGRRYTGERRAHAAHTLRKLDFSARRIAKTLGVDHTTILDDIAKPDPLEKAELDYGGGPKKGKDDKDYVIGSDNKRHPKKKKKRVQQVTKTDIETEEGGEPAFASARQKKSFLKLKQATIKSINMAMRCLDRLGLGDIHKDALQTVLNDVREIQRPGQVPEAAGAK
jgi:ParB-like chromosome segregation protein Spo0J